jgi:hypothetical protein
MNLENVPEEESLDPADWQLMRGLGHRMIDDSRFRRKLKHISPNPSQ